MNNYILSIPLALSQQLVDYLDENGIDFTEIAEQLEPKPTMKQKKKTM